MSFFHTNYCKPNFAHPCIYVLLRTATLTSPGEAVTLVRPIREMGASNPGRVVSCPHNCLVVLSVPLR
jgi:hypothetical protein